MMRRFWQWLSDLRVLTVLTLLMVLLCAYLWHATTPGVQLYLLTFLLALLTAWLLVAWIGWQKGKGAAAQLRALITGRRGAAPPLSDNARAEVAALQESLGNVLKRIGESRIGRTRGAQALYAMPWYMIIGNPAAGKSSAILHSGLQFPYSDQAVVRGVGGTRNCDWFFTSEGIVLDTAGRYAVQPEHAAEWLAFLDLLKKYRRRAPINGIIVAASIAELSSPDVQQVVALARDLRNRINELIARLEVHVPVYLMFTKTDLLPGFADFFQDTRGAEREQIWGATQHYRVKGGHHDALRFFDQQFDPLHQGLKELSVASLMQLRGAALRAGVLLFPAEFAALRPALRTFIATLFQDNAFQFKPVLRGFYFTSACQSEGETVGVLEAELAGRFHLDLKPAPPGTRAPAQAGFFLTRLFREVIFADRELVARYVSPWRIRLRATLAATIIVGFGLCLGAWSWSYLGNRQLAAHVAADLDKVIKLQEGNSSLQARLEALDILQDRLRQLARFHDEKPWSLGMGLYQGDILERKVRQEYFLGMREILLKPVGASLEALLNEVNTHPEALANGARPPDAAATVVSAEEAYNALKTYLMLSDKARAETGHLNDQLTRHWRGWLERNRGAMAREQLIRSAERLLTFYLSQAADPSWPQLDGKLALVEQTRATLRPLVRGMPARERVYAEIRSRANTRFAPLTVARIVGEADAALVRGSQAVPGAFTREAAEQFVLPAIRAAASQESRSTDWVLNSTVRDDLTLEGSPEQIRKLLLELYKTDYIRAWRAFMQGITIGELADFNEAVQAMNRLGDPQLSPLGRLLERIAAETAWDVPAARRLDPAAAAGVLGWGSSSAAQASAEALRAAELQGADPRGAISSEFAGVARLSGARERDNSLLRNYLDTLSKLRGRLNQLKNQGDPGPGARQLMQQTLDGNGSELAEALRLVDEQMLVGMSEAQKQALRPLLVRPLMQTFAVIVAPAAGELNQTWQAQVYQPFQKTLAMKAPFAPGGSPASAAEIAQIFGPDGAIARFAGTGLGPLVLRRGDTLSARTWAGMGLTLTPAAQAGLARWVTPPGEAAAQTRFELKPLAISGALEYTLEIDGQQLRYRNVPLDWTVMNHPGAPGSAGARITALTIDGRTVELFGENGAQALKRMIEAAARRKLDDDVFELRWTSGAIVVGVGLRLPGAGGADTGLRGVQLPPAFVESGGRAGAGAAP